MADRAVKGTVFRATGEEKQNSQSDDRQETPKGCTTDRDQCISRFYYIDYILVCCCYCVFTCDDVLYGAILPFVNMAAVFSLSSSELSD